MSKAKQLFELQEIDLDIQQKTEALAQVKDTIGKDDDIVSARAALEAARKQLMGLEHEQRTAEWGVDELEKKIAAEEKKLYEGSVKNPRELINLQQEIDHIKVQCREREDKLLAVMMEVDNAQKDVNQRTEEMEVMTRDWEEAQKRLSREQTELEADLDTLTRERESTVSSIDSDGILTYEELRRVKQGIAVAKLVQGRCQGCRISLPVSDQQKARMGQKLATCSNCGRILYMD
ncbi:zinc ribbon domain-containing protein [Chloroflexota bacterium]